MRWLSLDQKPSWWNRPQRSCRKRVQTNGANAADDRARKTRRGLQAKKGKRAPTVKENFGLTRSRYTILTAVPHGWKMSDHEDDVPLCAMLFKGKPGGKIYKKLERNPLKKPWMKMQVQAEGSYRSGDMVEVLNWMLPVAHSPDESIIVLLDWFSGHLTEEVAECIHNKGHVLLFHGGGTTPFTQINDTHLHARLAKLLLLFENTAAVNKRQELLARGIKKMPSVKHYDLVNMVQCSWMAIDHHKVAETGYKQTGPTMPMTGPVQPEDVYQDLLDVLHALDPDSTATEVSLKTMREAAIEFVRKGHEDGKWNDWSDYHMLIEPYDEEDEGAEEGMEAFGAEADYEDEDREPDSDNDDEDEGDGAQPGSDDDKGPAGDDGDGSLPSSDGGDDSGDDDEVDDEDPFDHAYYYGDAEEPHHGHDGAGVEDAPVAESALVAIADEPHHSHDGALVAPQPSDSQPSDEIWDAVQLLYNKAVRDRDDTALMFYRRQMRERSRDTKHGTRPEAQVLHKRALEQYDESLKAAKRCKAEERLAAQKESEKRTAEALANAKRDAASKELLEQRIVNKKFEDALIKRRHAEKLYRSWLQTKYPALLAERCIQCMFQMTPADRDHWRSLIFKHYKGKTFQRHLLVDDPWECDKNFTKPWGTIKAFDSGHVRSIRCAQPFANIIDSYAPQPTGVADAKNMLDILLSKCIPYSEKIFLERYGVTKLLHINDYVIEKTFVYAIMCLSKWLGKEIFTCGIYKWPPVAPADLGASDALVVPHTDDKAAA